MRYLAALIFLFCIVSVPASAHQVKQSGSLSVLQHSDPNDTPHTGTTTTIHLVFTDTEQRFTAAACECVVYVGDYAALDVIEEQGDRFVFAEGDLKHSYNENYSFEYVFPKRGIYAIVVEGKPKVAGAFEPFRIVFDLRVAYEWKDMMHEEMDMSMHRPPADGSPLRTVILAALAIVLGILIGRKFYNKY